MPERITFVIAESSIETIPNEILKNSDAKRWLKKMAKRKKKKPNQLILDSALHHHYLHLLKEKEKRGRPDIVHFSLLSILGSPLNKMELVNLYIHTIQDLIIHIKPETRLPKNYNRFIGLIEQLFSNGRVPIKGDPLLFLEKMQLKELVEKLTPSIVVIFSEHGKPIYDLNNYMNSICPSENLMFIVGGFAHGNLSKETIDLGDQIISIDPEPLETWIVFSRIISALESVISIPKKRFEQEKASNCDL